MKLTPDSKIVSQARLIVEAAEKGLEIQERSERCAWREPSGGTVYIGHPAVEYRIKPEPKIVYLNEYPSGFIDRPHGSVEAARGLAGHGCIRTAVPFREVTE